MPSVGWRWLFCVRRHAEFAFKVDLNRGTSLLFIVFIRNFTSSVLHTSNFIYYDKLPTSYAVSLLRIKIPKSTSQVITRNEQAEMRAWAKMHGKSVRQ